MICIGDWSSDVCSSDLVCLSLSRPRRVTLSAGFEVTRRDLANTMQPGGRSSTEGHEALALRRGLVVVQVALSMVLVVGALLFGRTLKTHGAVDMGFDPAVEDVAVDLSHDAGRAEAGSL